MLSLGAGLLHSPGAAVELPEASVHLRGGWSLSFSDRSPDSASEAPCGQPEGTNSMAQTKVRMEAQLLSGEGVLMGEVAEG